jgi:hypothetical protein
LELGGILWSSFGFGGGGEKLGQIVSTCFYLFTSDLNLDLKAQAKARGRDDPSQRAVDSVSVRIVHGAYGASRSSRCRWMGSP